MINVLYDSVLPFDLPPSLVEKFGVGKFICWRKEGNHEASWASSLPCYYSHCSPMFYENILLYYKKTRPSPRLSLIRGLTYERGIRQPSIGDLASRIKEQA